MTALDLDFIRDQFPAFREPSLAGQRHFENAGGSWACQQTIEALTAFTGQQSFSPIIRTQCSARGQGMDRAYARWADRLNVGVNELTIGPPTSINTYVLAQAFAATLSAGDEVIVTNQDHEANGGAWRKMADHVGATLKEWRVDPETGLLDVALLRQLLTPNTRLVTLPHCSNIVAHKNPIADWVQHIKAIAPNAFLLLTG